MYLMCKNTAIARIDFSKMIFDVYNNDLMPFALRGGGVDLFTVRDWISERVLNISRSNAKKIINALGLNQFKRVEMCLSCKGLSLTDCYWFKVETDEESTWENVNLYSNTLSNAVAKIALTGEYVSIQGRIRTPEITGQGAYAKCWRRINGSTYLYKGAGDRRIEHKLDVLCSDILDLLNVPHIEYVLTTIDGKEVSRCKNMTDENISICEMEYFCGYCNRNNINLDNWLRAQELYYQMLVIDYLILNTDRHLGNWGIYFNSNTGKPLGLHPLYDHNNSFNSASDGFKSQVINNKTLEECAKYGKSRCNIDLKPLEKWLKQSKTKQRFKSIFGSMGEYHLLLDRIEKYKSWK